MNAIAVVGTGHYGKNLVRNFHQLGVLKTVCDASPAIRKQMSDTYPAVTVTDDIDAVLNDEDIQGVVIASPAVTHYDLAMEALNAGKQVFVEKPLSLNYQDGLKLVDLAHETVVIDDDVEIGEKTKIWHFSHILSNSKIGENCNIGQNVVIGPDVTIGNKCKIQNNVSVYKGVTLEDGVFCGPSMIFTNIYNPRAEISKMDQVRPTLVKKGATLGANCTIVCGHTIGHYAFIGAGAVVTKDVPDHALMVGNPAKQIGWMCECGEQLDEEGKCRICGCKHDKSKLTQPLTPHSSPLTSL